MGWVVSVAPQPRFAPGKWPPVPIGWAPEPVWTQRLEEKSVCPCRGSNLGRPVRSETLYWLSYPGSYNLEDHYQNGSGGLKRDSLFLDPYIYDAVAFAGRTVNSAYACMLEIHRWWQPSSLPVVNWKTYFQLGECGWGLSNICCIWRTWVQLEFPEKETSANELIARIITE
jgi:hypothetical protein